MASSSSASKSFKALADNALDFLKKNAILFAPKSEADLPPEYRSKDGATFASGKAGLKLVKTKVSTVYELKFVSVKDIKASTDAISAFVVGFKQNQRNDDVPFVDILKKASYLEGNFVFTVGLTGCSVVVTSLDDNKYRVFHDRRMDSAVLYKDVEMYVNFDDYRIGGRYLSHTGNAITCMQFKDGEWKMFLQGQLPPRHSAATSASAPKWEVNALEKKKVKASESLEKAFKARREIIQKRVKNGAKKLKLDKNLIEGAKDGVVQKVEFDNDAIRGWKALRDAMTSQIEIDRRKGIAASLEDTYYRFEDDVTESEQIDETWIWLQIKKIKARP